LSLFFMFVRPQGLLAAADLWVGRKLKGDRS